MQEADLDWHLQEWLAHFGKRQASLVNELGWDKAKANFLFHGKQAYRRDNVVEVARWLGIRPYELLMPPAEAEELRRLRATAEQIVARNSPDRFLPPPFAPLQPPRKTGTNS